MLLGSFLLACGGGGGSGPVDPPPPPPPDDVITFVGSGSPGTNSIVLAEAPGTSADQLALRVEATSVTDLYGVAFDLVYPNELLAFKGVTEGTFISGGGQFATSFELSQGADGALIVGLSRLGQVAGATGSGTLMTIRLAKVAGGQGSISLQKREAVDSAGGELAPSWAGGTVTVPQ